MSLANWSSINAELMMNYHHELTDRFWCVTAHNERIRDCAYYMVTDSTASIKRKVSFMMLFYSLFLSVLLPNGVPSGRSKSSNYNDLTLKIYRFTKIQYPRGNSFGWIFFLLFKNFDIWLPIIAFFPSKWGLSLFF